jgi:hypothetical protein
LILAKVVLDGIAPPSMMAILSRVEQ